MDALHRILNFTWEKEEIPDDWKRDLLVKLTKKGDISRCGTWRGTINVALDTQQSLNPGHIEPNEDGG